MDLKKEFKLDDKRVRDGVWFNMETGLPVYSQTKVAQLRDAGIALVCCRPLGNVNRDYKGMLDDLLRPLRRQRRRGGKSVDDLIEEKITEAAAYHVVKDIANIEDDGQPVENTPEAKFEVMRTYPDLREEWMGYAAELFNYRMEEVADGAGNSQAPSATS